MPKVAVVGGGPAGSTCAARLAARGLEVTLLERSAFPRTKVCGEYLNSAAQEHLREFGVAEQIAAASNQIKGIRLHVEDTQLELPFAVPAWALARSRLDDVLLSHARLAGVRTITARVEHLERAGKRIQVRFRDASGFEHTLEADIVVGADGLGSIVARKCNLLSRAQRRGRFAVGGHYSGFGSLDEFIEMYVTAKAYFAINPLSRELANVMIVVDESEMHRWTDGFDRHMQETAVTLAAGKRALEAVRRIGKRVAIGPLAHQVRKVADENVYLVGDAAGFVDPFTGQGVFLALRSAKLAADAIEAELAQKERAQRARARYRTEYAEVYGVRARVAALVSFLIGTPWLTKRAARNLARNAELRESIMAIISGSRASAEPLNSAVILRLVA